MIDSRFVVSAFPYNNFSNWPTPRMYYQTKTPLN